MRLTATDADGAFGWAILRLYKNPRDDVAELRGLDKAPFDAANGRLRTGKLPVGDTARASNIMAAAWLGTVASFVHLTDGCRVLSAVIDTPRNCADTPDVDPASWTTRDAVADTVAMPVSKLSRAIGGALVPVTNAA
jgi:hypothetical protein